ncbi:unnamed protein product [Meloidogyne enterolobii]|uniref:Uncharacterized protein n=1 Tax=Meloidogyne enterolobii TaxID=390850 RepID=A0ACB0XRH7_MELEN
MFLFIFHQVLNKVYFVYFQVLLNVGCFQVFFICLCLGFVVQVLFVFPSLFSNVYFQVYFLHVLIQVCFHVLFNNFLLYFP